MKIVVSGQLAYMLKVGLKLLGFADGLDESRKDPEDVKMTARSWA